MFFLLHVPSSSPGVRVYAGSVDRAQVIWPSVLGGGVGLRVGGQPATLPAEPPSRSRDKHPRNVEGALCARVALTSHFIRVNHRVFRCSLTTTQKEKTSHFSTRKKRNGCDLKHTCGKRKSIFFLP